MRSEELGRLKRSIGMRDLVLFNLVAILSLRWLNTAAKSGPSAITLWILAAALFFVPQGLAVAELSARYPSVGGMYAWTKQRFGDGPRVPLRMVLLDRERAVLSPAPHDGCRRRDVRHWTRRQQPGEQLALRAPDDPDRTLGRGRLQCDRREHGQVAAESRRRRLLRHRPYPRRHRRHCRADRIGRQTRSMRTRSCPGSRRSPR